MIITTTATLAKVHIITLKTGIRIEVHGEHESLTISTDNECFDFVLSQENKFICDATPLRKALNLYHESSTTT